MRACVCDALGNDMLARPGPAQTCAQPASVYRNTSTADDDTAKFYFPIVFPFSCGLAQLHCHGERMSQVLDTLNQKTQSKHLNISHLQLDPLSDTFVFPRAKQTKLFPGLVREACYIRVTRCVRVTICYIYKRVHA